MKIRSCTRMHAMRVRSADVFIQYCTLQMDGKVCTIHLYIIFVHVVYQL